MCPFLLFSEATTDRWNDECKQINTKQKFFGFVLMQKAIQFDCLCDRRKNINVERLLQRNVIILKCQIDAIKSFVECIGELHCVWADWQLWYMARTMSNERWEIRFHSSQWRRRNELEQNFVHLWDDVIAALNIWLECGKREKNSMETPNLISIDFSSGLI